MGCAKGEQKRDEEAHASAQMHTQFAMPSKHPPRPTWGELSEHPSPRLAKDAGRTSGTTPMPIDSGDKRKITVSDSCMDG